MTGVFSQILNMSLTASVVILLLLLLRLPLLLLGRLLLLLLPQRHLLRARLLPAHRYLLHPCRY